MAAFPRGAVAISSLKGTQLVGVTDLHLQDDDQFGGILGRSDAHRERCHTSDAVSPPSRM
jgi:hypothetical protein